MKKTLFLTLLLLSVSFFASTKLHPNKAHALTLDNTIINTNIDLLDADEATDSADASDSGKLASPSAAVVEKIQEKKDQDITETTGKQKSDLEAYLDEIDPGPLGWNNFIQHSIRISIVQGLQANVIVLILLFPLVASVIVASRHIIGLRGFGIYIPAVLAVALVSTGVLEGLFMFFIIALTAMLAKKLLKKTNFSYLPRTALMLWMVSISIFVILTIAPLFNLFSLAIINIFPILILILLAENFLDAQAKMKQRDAIVLTAETILLAVFSGFLLKWEPLQQFALSEPELLILFTGVINILVGKFTGLRVTERLRFRSIIEEE